MNIYEVIKNTKGKIFSCSFVKKDGTIRKMVCRTGVTKYLKGGEQSYSPKDFGLVTVFDMQKLNYRVINTQTLLNINGVSVKEISK